MSPRVEVAAPDLLIRIRGEITSTAHAGPRPAGGLLLGAIADGTIRIRDFVPLASIDPASLESVVSLDAHRSRRLSPLGYWRASRNESMRLDTYDLQLVRRFFPGPNAVVMLVRGFEASGPEAAFFFFEYGELIPGSAAAPGDRFAPRGKRARAIAGVAAALACAAALGVTAPRWWPRVPAVPFLSRSAGPPQSRLELQAERSGSDFRITWDRKSPFAEAATGGRLSIEDGGGKREIQLNAEEARTGSVFHQPGGDRVRIELALTAPDRTVAIESVTLLLSVAAPAALAPAAEVPTLTASIAAPMSEPQPKQQPLPSLAQQPSPQRQPEATQPPRQSSPQPPQRQGESARLRAREFVSPPSLRGAPPSPDQPVIDVPEVLMAAVRSSTPIPFALGSQSAVPRPASPGGEQSPRSEPPAELPRPVSAVVPPIPISQPLPKMTPLMKSFVTRDTALDVRVTVDRNGATKSVQVIDQRGVNGYLAQSAIEAVRLWRFRPAQQEGRPVEGVAVVRLRFVRTE